MNTKLPRSVVVTFPPPTPNGGLHVGHLTGPFLSADAFARAARLDGATVFTSCYSDLNQSYVRVTALRQKRDPHELADYWTRDIIETLDLASISVDDYFPTDAKSKTEVQQIFHGLFCRGVLTKKKFPVYKSIQTAEFLDEAGVSGYCPACLSPCKSGICESCSSVNSPATLMNPSVTLTGEKSLVVEYVEVMVLEMERFRKNLIEAYERNKNFRPRFNWVVEDALKNELPDFPITTPGNWGFPIDHDDFPGQVINAWPEIMAQQIYSYKRAFERGVGITEDTAFINFYGFDNSYFYAVVHAIMLSLIDEGRWLPCGAVNNEFYNLDHQKFSTSNNHVIWSKDLLGRHSSDAIRFYAALNNPGFEKANFNEIDMVTVLNSGLYRLWDNIARQYNLRLREFTRQASNPSFSAQKIGSAAISRIFDSYSLERFHLRQAAEDLLHLMGYIETTLYDETVQLIDVAYLLRCLAVAISPIAPDAGDAVHRSLTGVPTTNTHDLGPVLFRELPLAPFGH
jgi:methionyl-tRNA synthetase